MKKILIKYHADIERIKKIEIGDWIDLRAAEDCRLTCGEYKLISLGISMKLPKGYEAHVLPRGSTPSKFGIMLANSQGIIDNSYSGDGDIWHFPAHAIEDTIIHKGDRICQFRIVKKMPKVKLIEVDRLGGKDRGGIGSTGRK